MDPFQFFRDLYLWLKYRHAALVNSREELDLALAAMPPRIVVQGDEALRAFAASLLHPETEAVARMEAELLPPLPGEGPTYLLVPTIGRIRDGYRSKARPKRAQRLKLGERLKLGGGLDSVLVAVLGIFAALLMEWLIFPDLSPRMIKGIHHPAHAATAAAPPMRVGTILFGIAIPVLGAIAAGALAWLVWQALGLGRPVATGWRLEHRVQGRLVMVRVRRRT